MLRLLRIFRILKMGRYSRAMQTIWSVLVGKRAELAATLFISLVLLILGSSAVYYAEHPAQPDKFPDIPSSLWWGVTVLSTVGYGDVVPQTGMGKFLGSLVALLGIGMFALPTGILGAAFVEEIRRQRGAGRTCPHCGGGLDR